MTTVTSLPAQKAAMPTQADFSALMKSVNTAAGTRAATGGSIRLAQNSRQEFGIFVKQPPNSLNELVSGIKAQTGGRPPARYLNIESVRSSLDSKGSVALTFNNGEPVKLDTVVNKLMAAKVLKPGSTIAIRFDTDCMSELGVKNALLATAKLSNETGVNFELKPRPGSQPSMPRGGVIAGAVNAAGAIRIQPQAATTA